MDERKEMPHWIFVISNSDSEFEKRMKKKEWPIFSFTANRKKLEIDDSVVFYKAGIGGQKFLGKAEVASKIKKGEGKIDYFVSLKNTESWKKPVKIKPLVGKLDFIKDKNVWGRHMQGGVRSLSGKDFSTVVKCAS